VLTAGREGSTLVSGNCQQEGVNAMSFQQVEWKQPKLNPFASLLDAGALLTAGNEHKFNTMTFAWGGFGAIWNKPVVMVAVRPQRYTYEFMEAAQYFTVSFFDKKYHKALKICGAKTGRNCDKVAEAGLTPYFHAEDQVGFCEAETIYILKKIYFQDIDPANFLIEDIAPHYKGDFHRIYYGEVISVLQNSES
jgi:hypothetical protein